MGETQDSVRAARELLGRERADVLAALAAARAEGRRIAEEQKAWRAEATRLLERGDAAGLSVTEMAKALGLSRQWATHLRADARRRGALSLVVCKDEAPGWHWRSTD